MFEIKVYKVGEKVSNVGNKTAYVAYGLIRKK